MCYCLFLFNYPLLEIFLPTPLIITCEILQNQTFHYIFYLPYYAKACKEFAVPSPRHGAKVKPA